MTSGQYSYLLLRKLQTYVSCTDATQRAYLYNFFGEVFNDPSVHVDESSYNMFCNSMDNEMDYLARKNLYLPEDIYGDENFGKSYVALQNAFAHIGIQLELIEEGGYPVRLKFTLPSGRQLELLDLGGDQVLSSTYTSLAQCLMFRSRLNVTDDYFDQMNSYYFLEHEERLDLSDMKTNKAGSGTYWKYNSKLGVLDISGRGYLVGDRLWHNLGIQFSTMIIGAGVNQLLAESAIARTVMVFMHGAADFIELDDYWCTAGSQLIIYTDNEIVKNHTYPENAVAEMHSLSEWGGV